MHFFAGFNRVKLEVKPVPVIDRFYGMRTLSRLVSSQIAVYIHTYTHIHIFPYTYLH